MTKQNMKHNYQKVCSKVLANLSEKQKQVLGRRFGLVSNKKETLQKIGNDFSITRERVRQIEKEGFTKLSKLNSDKELEVVLASFVSYLKKNGGLKREDILLGELGDTNEQNQILFLLTLGKDFCHISEKNDLFGFWALNNSTCKDIEKALSVVLTKFKQQEKPLIKQAVLNTCPEFSPKFVASAIEISKHIEKGPLGEYGLCVWPEIKPKGVRDAAFIALKSNQEPLHFRDIAKLATSLTDGFSNRKEVLPQTVHNELIRDNRFVLVGRGLYALKEWGYTSGTVKQVLVSVLEKAKTPLTRNQILGEVQKQRLVKDNTVFLNLADKSHFLRNTEGRYTLQQS